MGCIFGRRSSQSHKHLYNIITNSIAKIMEVGCLRHPQACHIGSQLLDEDPHTPMADKSSKRSHELLCKRVDRYLSHWKEGGEGRGMLKDVLPCKAMLTINTIAVKAAKTSQWKSTWSPGACTYQNNTDNYQNAGALCC